MQFRAPTGQEMMAAHSVWRQYLYPALKDVKIVDDYFRQSHVDTLVFEWDFEAPSGPLEFGRSTFVSDDRSPTAFIFCPAAAGIASFCHELGHAVHDRVFPESRGWGVEKAEAFALLADVNATRWRSMEPGERSSFAQHYRACHSSPSYWKPLHWAYSVRKLPLVEQCQRIAAG